MLGKTKFSIRKELPYRGKMNVTAIIACQLFGPYLGLRRVDAYLSKVTRNDLSIARSCRSSTITLRSCLWFLAVQ